MKKHLAIILTFFLIFSLVQTFEVQATNDVEERYIVIFERNVDKDYVEQVSGEIEKEFDNIPALEISISPNAVRGLSNNPNVVAIERDQPVAINQQNFDWGINHVEAPLAWQQGYTGRGVNIAVLDTGIERNHPDLIDNIKGGVNFTSSDRNDWNDREGHGTHVAGIIGAVNNNFGTVGIAHEANLYGVKVLGDDGSGSLFDVIAGIDWAISNGMNIINLSLGTDTQSLALQQMVDAAYNQGILVVAAAGNTGSGNDTIQYPAKYHSVIAVGAINQNNQRASFSSTGPAVEVVAPGQSILSTYIGNSYATLNGTSMAAPYVAGNLALKLQAYPDLSHTELRQKLQENAIDLGEPGRDQLFGYGLIQAPTEQNQNQILFRVGDRDERVIDLKRQLTRLGFGGMNINEVYGSFTAIRVSQFQAYYGLPATGDTDERTLRKLNEILSTPFQEGERHSDTILLKKKLHWLGYGGMNLNEVYGSFTALRVSQFQADHGLKDHGIADQKTLNKMDEVLSNIFQVGSVHDSVIHLKRDLVRLGFGGMNINAVYGSFTAVRVSQLQEYYGLEPTGNADIATLLKIEEILSTPLQEGFRHPDTIELKQKLNRLDFGGMNINEVYGSFTALRVRQFQSYYGLVVNGIADERTLAMLDYIFSSPFQEGQRHPDTIILKQKLQVLGYGGMNLNDLYGSFTALRVREFQEDHGLKAHGIADFVTLNKMDEEIQKFTR